MSAYFVAHDANNDRTIWRRNGDRPQALLREGDCDREFFDELVGLVTQVVQVPLLAPKAIDFQHCDECGDAYPDDESSCPHGRLLCESHRWDCNECSRDLADDQQAELTHDAMREGA